MNYINILLIHRTWIQTNMNTIRVVMMFIYLMIIPLNKYDQ